MNLYLEKQYSTMNIEKLNEFIKSKSHDFSYAIGLNIKEEDFVEYITSKIRHAISVKNDVWFIKDDKGIIYSTLELYKSDMHSTIFNSNIYCLNNIYISDNEYEVSIELIKNLIETQISEKNIKMLKSKVLLSDNHTLRLMNKSKFEFYATGLKSIHSIDSMIIESIECDSNDYFIEKIHKRNIQKIIPFLSMYSQSEHIYNYTEMYGENSVSKLFKCWAANYLDSGNIIALTRKDGDVIGCLFYTEPLSICGRKIVVRDFTCILPEFRGKGLAMLLYNHLKEIFSKNVEFIESNLMANNYSNMKLIYKTNGWLTESRAYFRRIEV